MSHRIDQLFKDSLSEHKVSPSEEAWAKVQSGLSKKNKIIIVWQMAAVLALFGALVGAWSLLNNNESTTPSQLTEKNEIIAPKNVIEKPVESTNEIDKPSVAQTVKPESNKKRNKNKEILKENQNSITENIVMNNSELQKRVEDKAIVTEPVLIAQTVKSEKPIVIEFTLESISKEPTTEVAQASVEENSGLKKILEAARDVKNGESDLGMIRDAKNQLFAFDFKKDKTKRN